MTRIGIIGAGSWGTALAFIAGRAGHSVSLWSRSAAIVHSIKHEQKNNSYLAAITLPGGVRAFTEFEPVTKAADLLIFAAPSHAARTLLRDVHPYLDPKTILVSAAKGLEVQTGKRISEIVTEELGSLSRRFVCLSGPSFAREVVAGHPTAIVAASELAGAATEVQSALSFENLRVYTNSDVIGTELGGSVKNVMAIASGMVTGLGFGTNSVAALITRGLAEISRLALAEGARIETLMGLAGLGDLVLTCTGALSRNRHVGEQLGTGRSLTEITSGMNEVAEGIKTTMALKQLAERRGIEMPITNEVYAVLYEGKAAREAVSDLMRRPLREESAFQ